MYTLASYGHTPNAQWREDPKQFWLVQIYGPCLFTNYRLPQLVFNSFCMYVCHKLNFAEKTGKDQAIGISLKFGFGKSNMPLPLLRLKSPRCFEDRATAIKTVLWLKNFEIKNVWHVLNAIEAMLLSTKIHFACSFIWKLRWECLSIEIDYRKLLSSLFRIIGECSSLLFRA